MWRRSDVEAKHTPFSSSASSSVVFPVTTVLGGTNSSRKTEALNRIQREKEERERKGTVNQSSFVEPTVNLTGTEHITPLYNSSFSSCPFAGVFPRYPNDHVIRPSKEEIALLQSNRLRSPSHVDVADMRSRVRPSSPSHW